MEKSFFSRKQLRQKKMFRAKTCHKHRHLKYSWSEKCNFTL
jgi:hypothetical protein